MRVEQISNAALKRAHASADKGANSTDFAPAPSSRKWPRFLNRREAPRYLKDEWGITRSASTLMRLASVGGGPVYKKFGRAVVYDTMDLDAWVEARLSAPKRSTSDE